MRALTPALWRLIAVVAGVIVAAVGLSEATFTAGPGEAVLLERGGHIVAGPLAPGLHWRIPLVEGVIRLESGVRLAKGRVQVGSGADVLGARYAVLWRVAAPRRYYQATAGAGNVVAERLDAALAPALRTVMNAAQPRDFLARPAATIDSALGTVVQAPAEKLGIDVLRVGLEEAEVPTALQEKIGAHMAADASRRAAASASSGAAAQIAAARAGHAQAQAIVAAAQRAAAEIRGRSEAQTAEIYARAAVQAPQFFRFYQELSSEEQAMSSHTRALVISTDSAWFKELRGARHAAAQGHKG